MSFYNQTNIYHKNKRAVKQLFCFWCGGWTWRMLRLCLAYYWLDDRCCATVPVSPLIAKNSSPNCFLYALTLTGSSPFYKKINEPKMDRLFLVRGMGLEPT